MALYKDFGLTFKQKSDGAGLDMVEDSAAIYQSLLTILKTRKGELAWFPEFGSDIEGYLFEKVNFITSELIKQEFLFSIANWEPRVNIISISVTPKEDEHIYDVQIIYEVVSTSETGTLNLILGVG